MLENSILLMETDQVYTYCQTLYDIAMQCDHQAHLWEVVGMLLYACREGTCTG